MDWIISLLICLEALLACFLLYRSGLLKNPGRIYLSAILVAGAFALRILCLSYETLDYQDFLSKWVDFFRQNGGFKALKYPVGNYNIPYLYVLALFSYLPLDDLYLIKLFSILFDVLLAWVCLGLSRHFGAGERGQLGCFFAVLYLPTVVLNGALWGQCDSVYVALGLLGIYFALEKKPWLSMVMLALSFGFKLQAVFILPIAAVLLFRGDLKLKHFLAFPLSYVLLVLPAVFAGRPFLDTLTLYLGQTGSIGSGLNYNSPSIFGILWRVQDEAKASAIAIAAAFFFMGLVLLLCFFFRRRLSDKALLAASVLLAVGIPFLLPHMHDRYFFAGDILCLLLAFSVWQLSPAAVLCQFASLLGYHAYLYMRYFLPMSYGSWALILVLIMAAGLFFQQIFSSPKNKFQKRA